MTSSSLPPTCAQYFAVQSLEARARNVRVRLTFAPSPHQAAASHTRPLFTLFSTPFHFFSFLPNSTHMFCSSSQTQINACCIPAPSVRNKISPFGSPFSQASCLFPSLDSHITETPQMLNNDALGPALRKSRTLTLSANFLEPL